jgi:dimethylglycine dehydrogenase
MVVATKDIDVSNDEAVMVGDKAVGYVSSGGYAHSVGKSVAFGYVPTDLAKPGTKVEIEINGERFPAEILGAPLYDPNGGKMRA